MAENIDAELDLMNMLGGDHRLYFLQPFNPAVFHIHTSTGVLCNIRFVSDHDDGFSLLVEFGEYIKYLFAGCGVEISGWFVGKKYSWVV